MVVLWMEGRACQRSTKNPFKPIAHSLLRLEAECFLFAEPSCALSEWQQQMASALLLFSHVP